MVPSLDSTSVTYQLLDHCNSTNSELAERVRTTTPQLPHLYTLATTDQTTGRGQRGNSWYCTPQRDLALSTLLRWQDLRVATHYVVSEIIALCTHETLAHYLGAKQILELCIKWPNDIYYQDNKLSGILIEHSLQGQYVDYSIAGIGINIGGSHYPTYHPLATSLYMIIGDYIDPIELLHYWGQRLELLLSRYQGEGRETIHRLYMERLYRREGYHPYRIPEGTKFSARIIDVLPTGHLYLEREDGQRESYAFKEISFVC